MLFTCLALTCQSQQILRTFYGYDFFHLKTVFTVLSLYTHPFCVGKGRILGQNLLWLWPAVHVYSKISKTPEFLEYHLHCRPSQEDSHHPHRGKSAPPWAETKGNGGACKEYMGLTPFVSQLIAAHFSPGAEDMSPSQDGLVSRRGMFCW